jgi:alkylation response protein AidB-like acyl-CoA dehydrogenase
MTKYLEDLVAIADGADRFALATFGQVRARAHAGRDDEALRLAGAEGWLALLVPEVNGGAGQGLVAACAVAEAFAKHLSPMSYTALAAPAPILVELGFTRIEEALDGRLIVACALRAVTDESVLVNRERHGCWLTGSCRGVFWGGAADFYLVEGSDAGEPVLALISRGASGVSTIARSTVDGLGVADISFDNSPVEFALHGGAAAAALLRLRSWLAVLSAAELIGVSETALSITLEHLKTRQQFGRPLASFQALQFKAVDAYAGLGLARALTQQAARLLDTDERSSFAAAAAARAKAGDAAIFLHRAALQMHGAIGFSEEHSIGLYLKRALSLSVAWGNSADWRRAITHAPAAAEGVVFRVDAPCDAAFRKEVRAWIATELPTRLRNLPTRPSVADALWWHCKLYERGWIAPSWPKEYGGMGCSVAQMIILHEELGSAGAPEISGQAIYHFGPILQIFGTPEQKARFLPDMLSGAAMWCQGYSEPGAGSDLASLRTRAVRDGDHFIVNGSKIWTTWGQHAHWMFALVRTNSAVKKQEGITFLMIEMNSPGVTRRPIRTIAGEEEFAEIFFDDVRVPVDNVIGEVDGGWRVANAVLEKERLHGANPIRCAQLLARVKNVARTSGSLDEASFADRLARAEIDHVALCATFAQIVEIAETGTSSRGDFAFAKLVSGELQQQLCELLVEACGSMAAVSEPLTFGDEKITPGIAYMQNRRATIYGGSSEVQRLLIARRVLGLAGVR